MKNVNLNNAVYVVLVIAALTAFAVYTLTAPVSLDFKVARELFGWAAFVVAVAVFVFVKWAWKWPIFRYLNWLVLIPNLNGTWHGEIRSTWRDTVTGKRPAPILAVLTIRQTLFSLSCVVRTEEMVSRSFSAAFLINDEEQRDEISYSYSSVPNQTVIKRSEQHIGSALLEIDESSDPNTLCGRYWSNRNTDGDMKFSFVDRQETKCFPEEMKNQHPVSAARNYES